MFKFKNLESLVVQIHINRVIKSLLLIFEVTLTFFTLSPFLLLPTKFRKMSRWLGFRSPSIKFSVEFSCAGHETFISVSIYFSANLFVDPFHISIHGVRGEEITIFCAPFQFLKILYFSHRKYLLPEQGEFYHR